MCLGSSGVVVHIKTGGMLKFGITAPETVRREVSKNTLWAVSKQKFYT